MALPTAQQVADFLGRGDDTAAVALAGEHLPIVTAMVRRYVRGKGFVGTVDCDEDVAAVIISSTARLTNNPTMTTFSAIDDAQVRQGTFNGWTLPELAILHSYRARAR